MTMETEQVSVTVEVPNGEGEATSNSEGGEAIAEAIEEASSDAVEIARIEAEKEIVIETIHAETEQARIEAETEIHTEQVEERSWQEEKILALETEVQGMRADLAEIRNTLIPPPPLETEAVEAAAEITEELLETPSETSLIPPFIADPTSEIQTEVSVENADGEQIAEVRARRFRPI